MSDLPLDVEPQLPPRTSERLLIESLDSIVNQTARRALCTSLGRGQLAKAIAERFSATSVECLFLDLYLAEQATQALSPCPANLAIQCQPDFSPGEAELVAIPTAHDGTAELTRDLLQQGFEALTLGGTMLAATDREQDTWLREELEKLFGKVAKEKHPDGVVYRGVKSGPLKKRKNFDCWFPLRDGEQILTLLSRPGVFCHRRPDLGARALLAALAMQSGDRVFEIGCGSGAVTLAAAARNPRGKVYAVDSNPRAVECTQRGAEANGITNVAVALEADARCDEPGTYDLVVANPPYYSQQRIAEVFVRGALAALRPGGSVQFVTKHPAWYEERFVPLFRDVFVDELKGYFVVTGAGVK